MPYVKPESRPSIDALTSGLISHMRGLPLEEQDGALNYAITRVLISVYPRRYFHLNRALGVLDAVSKEFYRVVVGPYEDIKRREHGPVGPEEAI